MPTRWPATAGYRAAAAPSRASTARTARPRTQRIPQPCERPLTGRLRLGSRRPPDERLDRRDSVDQVVLLCDLPGRRHRLRMRLVEGRGNIRGLVEPPVEERRIDVGLL